MAFAQKRLEEIFIRFAEQHSGTETTTLKLISQLDPALQELCGICHVEEDDLNGDNTRKMVLMGVPASCQPDEDGNRGKTRTVHYSTGRGKHKFKHNRQGLGSWHNETESTEIR